MDIRKLSFLFLLAGCSTTVTRDIASIDESCYEMLKYFIPGSLSSKKSFYEVQDFLGKESFLDFKHALVARRKTLDTLYPLTSHFKVGHEGFDMTLISEPQKLVNRKVIGIEATFIGTYKSPLISATIRPYEGIVKKVVNVGGSIYPDYRADILLADGNAINVSLTSSRGLRVPKEKETVNLFDGGEMVLEANRIKGTREQFLKNNTAEVVRPKAYVRSSSNIRKEFEGLPSEKVAAIKEFRERLLKILKGKKEYEYLGRTELDEQIRLIPKLRDENYRAMIEEAQRLMNDTDSEMGFKNWFADLITEVLIEKEKKGDLQWVSKQSTLADIHFNYPWGEGQNGLPSRTLRLDNFPMIEDDDLIRVLDKRIERMGFHVSLSKFENIPMSPVAQHIAILKGDNLDETTPLFLAYTRENVQFLDDYFTGKPHGVYSHILQNLYMAERFIEPSMNSFGQNVYKPFLGMQNSLLDDSVAATRFNDYVGLNSPANPDHINNLLKLVITDDIKLKYVKEGHK